MRRVFGWPVILLLCVLMLASVARAVDIGPGGRMYGGYVFIYNAETGNGFVYANNKRTSVLAVFYPDRNVVYFYSTAGQIVLPADDVGDMLFNTYGLSKEHVLSVIKRVR